jgi:putative dimethyl sulfoxide reductase chaperone
VRRATGEERALARATIYRMLSLAFSYPTVDSVAELGKTFESSRVAADLIGPAVAREVRRLAAGFAAVTQPTLETSYQRVFTLSYSEDCPIHETAFSARHLFQQVAHQADIAGFYKAFGVDAQHDRSDHIAMELEFCYLLALKEARARSRRETEHVSICRQGQRAFVGQHLARWAPLTGQRIVVTGAGTWYERAAWLLLAFVEFEERYLRLGAIERFRDDPVLIADEPGDLTCPILEGAVEEMIQWPAPAAEANDDFVATAG